MNNSITGHYFTLMQYNTVNKVASDSPYTASAKDTVLCDAIDGNIIVKLPLAATAINTYIVVKKIDASVNTITIQRQGSDTIDGAASRVLTQQNESVFILAASSSSYIIQSELKSYSGVGASNSFETISTDLGTSPTASSSTDTLTLTSADGSIVITGTAGTDTVNFAVDNTKVDHNSTASKQGGTTDEYFHLTEAEHKELTEWLDDVTLSDGGSVDLGTGDITAALVQGTTSKLGDVAGGNYTEIEADGTLVINGDGRTYRDELGDASKLKTVGIRVFFDDVEGTLNFSQTATLTDYAILNVQLNHDKDLTSSIYPHIHWFQTSSSVPNFLLQYRWQKGDSAKTTAWTNYKCNTAVNSYVSGTLNQICHNGGITPPVGTGLSDIVQFRIIRDTTNASGVFTGADPLLATVNILFFDIHFMTDTLGSRTEYTK